MNITLFNGLSGLQVRGISKVADELAYQLRRHGHIVNEVRIPRNLYFKSTLVRVLALIFYQQIICPIIALTKQSDLIIDPYNGFPIIAALFIRTKYFIHDYTPFKRKYWFLRPGTIYQLVMFKLDMNLSLADMYHVSLEIETPDFLRRAIPPKVFPNIVEPLDTTKSGFFKENIKSFYDKMDVDCLLLTTISGTSWNKDFDGLINNLRTLGRQFLLVAFGFGDQGVEKTEVSILDGRLSFIFTVGFVEEASIADSIIHSHLFVFHSLSEGFGRPVIEALQLKRLVVTADVPVVRMMSPEAIQNIFLYRNQNEFKSAFDKALASRFISFSKIYKSNINCSIEQLLN